MAGVSFSACAGEALLLGLATGPVCLASCGAVVLPWMLVQPQGLRAHGRQLFLFLMARLVGYLVFGAAVWRLGSTMARAWGGRSWILGVTELLLCVALLAYAAGWPHAQCLAARKASELVQLGPAPQPRRMGALALGFLTGINLCPPFLVAGVRVAELGSLGAALLFFTFFFAGTAIWFAPFLGLGLVRRTPEFVFVGRLAAILLACWYGLSGVFTLMERTVYG